VSRLAAALAALLALACAAPIRTDLNADNEPKELRTVALVPLESDPLIGYEVPSDAAPIVTARLSVALGSETKLRLVEPGRADAVLTGVVRRWVERDGSSTGVRHPASVWFALELRDPDGRVIWTGTYEETQAALSDDLGSFPRCWERGFRWVTAADLADYGARQLVEALQREVGGWS